MTRRRRLLAGAATLSVLLAMSPASRSAAFRFAGPPDAPADELAMLMKGVGERVRDYYDRVTSIICTETVTQRELHPDLTPFGKIQQTVYDLAIVRQPNLAGRVQGEVVVERTIRSIDGRPARGDDRPHWADPKPITEEPLAFILPENQGNYRFSMAVSASTPGPADPLVVDFEQMEADPVEVAWAGEYFSAAGGRVEGQIWVDQRTRDVLRLDTRLMDPMNIPIPWRVGPTKPLTAERIEMTFRFAVLTFQDPEETLLLPQSVERVIVVRGSAVPRLRTTQTYKDFRRFRAEVTIKGVR